MLVTSPSAARPAAPEQPDALVYLRAAGSCVLVDCSIRSMLSVVHWGEDLGPLDEGSASAVTLAGLQVVDPGEPEGWAPVRLPVDAHDGFTGRPGIRGSRGGVGWSPVFTVRSVQLDGRPVAGWHCSGAGAIVVAGVDAETKLGLEVTVELTGSGVLRMRATLTNLGAEYQLDDLVLALPVPAAADELLDVAGGWGRDCAVQRRAFTVGTHLREGRSGRAGTDTATVLHAGTKGFGFGAGQVWALHVGWSGNHTHYAEHTGEGQRMIGGGELLLPGEVRLAHGVSYRTPWVFAAYGVGLDEVAHRFHGYLRSAADPRPTPLVTFNTWQAVNFDHDERRVIDLAERAAAVGVERFVLDDGWFGDRRNDRRGLGDWTVSGEVWPNGLHPLVDRVRSLGMQFGLWLEPEMVNPDSDLARSHPEWVMSARNRWPVESRSRQVLNLGIPECYDHLLRRILAILDEYDISFLRWDHNRDIVEGGNQLTGGVPAVRRHTLALYRMLEELRTARPGLEIETCSAGGRIDLGVLRYTGRVSVGDCLDPRRQQSMLRWAAQLVPPQLLGSQIGRPTWQGGRHDLGIRAAAAIFGHLGIEWDLALATEREVAELGEWVAFYAAHRDLLVCGDVVRLDDPGEGLLVHGVVAADRSRAVFALIRIAETGQQGAPVRLRGLDADRRYRVRPVLIGEVAGLQSPRWWGGSASSPRSASTNAAPMDVEIGYPGAVFTGRSLQTVGVRPPLTDPGQAVLLVVDGDRPHLC